MDVIVNKIPDSNNWALADLLGRDVGRISEIREGVFIIQPAGNAVRTLKAIASRSYASVDDALAAIEEHTRGQCRRAF